MNGQAHPESALLVGAAQSVWNGSEAVVTIQIGVAAKLQSKMAEYNIGPLESVFITDSDIRHIKRKHAKMEAERGQLPILPADFAFLPDVLNDFDTCEHTDTDKLGNKKFLLAKDIGGVYYVVTIQRGKKKLEIKTMWKRPGASC
jgi:hypothetical protein